MARLKSEIHFGLVNIPVTYQAIIKDNDISFHQLHKKCMNRIRYQKVCPHCKTIVKETDLVKGYEVNSSEYVTFTKQELQSLKLENDGIEIISFIEKKSIPSYFYEKTYTLLPPKKSQSYSLFIEVLKKSRKVALAKTTLGTKFYYCFLEVVNSYLIMTTLYFLEEINLPEELKQSKFTKKEMELGEMLVKKLNGSFAPKEYQDEYQQSIKKAINEKMNGKKLNNKKHKKQASVKNLIDALQSSLGEKK